MLGSSQNIALPNIVLNTAVADIFREFADRLENAESFDAEVKNIIKTTLSEHKRVIFNGNGYSPEWEAEAEKRGLPNIKRSYDAFGAFTSEKNIALFERNGVMSRTEIESRKEILYENYAKTVNIEAQTMIEMVRREYIPAVERYISELAKTAKRKSEVCKGISCKLESELITRLTELNEKAYTAVDELAKITAETVMLGDFRAEAEGFCYKVIPTMERLRESIDSMEKITGAEYWPVPSYGDLTYYIDK